LTATRTSSGGLEKRGGLPEIFRRSRVQQSVGSPGPDQLPRPRIHA